MSKFLTEGFNTPSKSSQFMKFAVGKNQFRIVSSLVEGYVVFTEENKPKRKKIVRDDNGKILPNCSFTPAELKEAKAKTNDKGLIIEPKYFWLVLVYNHNAKKVQALEITQKGIINSMQEYLQQEDWSDPSAYDFIVTKKGEGLTTEYSVSTSLPKPLPDEAISELEVTDYDLNAVFDNEYPIK